MDRLPRGRQPPRRCLFSAHPCRSSGKPAQFRAADYARVDCGGRRAPSYDELLAPGGIPTPGNGTAPEKLRVDELTRAPRSRPASRPNARPPPFSRRLPSPTPELRAARPAISTDRTATLQTARWPMTRSTSISTPPFARRLPRTATARSSKPAPQDTQDQVELPAKPLRRRFHIHCGQCRPCGRRLRGRHPLQTSDATGAAASPVGPQAQALVVYLNKHAGLSHGKTADVLTPWASR